MEPIEFLKNRIYELESEIIDEEINVEKFLAEKRTYCKMLEEQVSALKEYVEEYEARARIKNELQKHPIIKQVQTTTDFQLD